MMLINAPETKINQKRRKIKRNECIWLGLRIPAPTHFWFLSSRKTSWFRCLLKIARLKLIATSFLRFDSLNISKHCAESNAEAICVYFDALPKYVMCIYCFCFAAPFPSSATLFILEELEITWVNELNEPFKCFGCVSAELKSSRLVMIAALYQYMHRIRHS